MEYQVIVVGGGHAGVEAAMAAARTGASTLLLTQSIETIGHMSCNPAIGGIGKSHLVREIDALDGLMARATDRAGIHFRVLNGSKGPAVRATRAQADRVLYRNAVRQAVERQAGLHCFQQAVDDLVIENGRVAGVRTAGGLELRATSVVLTTGTFLGGVMHVGMNQQRGGRAGDPAATTLAGHLRQLPLPVGRLKTGTPPRIDGRTVDFSVMGVQPGDDPLPVMSYLGSVDEHPRQTVCHITETNAVTHELIRTNLDRSPLYGGVIEGVGPRYCPSIEDKVVRFADRQRHQIFVEPEGLDTPELYPNGISTSLPFDVQYRIVRSIRGFEDAHITRPGYAIEYDYFDPRGLLHTLESRSIDGLFMAGQINGTTGYEEAAAQGLIAGLNAARKAAGLPGWCPRRDEAYIGVMIDDLVTHGTSEPYRMFTSRAEFRLLLREDNADLRLTARGRELGLVGDERWRHFTARTTTLDALREALHAVRLQPGTEPAARWQAATGQSLSRDVSGYDLLRRPTVRLDDLRALLPADLLGRVDASVAMQIETEARYEGYVVRQHDEIERLRRHESIPLPATFDYSAVSGLTNELRSKLAAARPENLGRAARIPGMTPAALGLLLVHARRVGQAD